MSEGHAEYKAGEQVKLLPCPFCGSDSVEVMNLVDDESPDLYFVACKNKECEAEGPVHYFEDDAIRAWNIRVKETRWLGIPEEPID